MQFEQLATKEDLLDLKQDLLKILGQATSGIKMPVVCELAKAREILGGQSGPVSISYIIELRRKKVLNPKKIGGKWIFNVKELVSVLPPDPENKK